MRLRLAQQEQMNAAKRRMIDSQYNELLEQTKTLVSDARAKLSKFAASYASQIEKDPKLLTRFSSLCLELDLDPIVSRLNSS